MTSMTLALVVIGVLIILAVGFGIVAFEEGKIGALIQTLRTILADKQLDAIVIGLAGAATFIGSSISAIAQNPANWHPQSFGIGFGSLASGLGVLFKLRQRRHDDDENR